MKIIIMILLINIAYSVDIQKLIIYKETYKKEQQNISYKKIPKSIKSITIISDHIDIANLEMSYDIKLNKCILNNICIFDIANNININELIQKIKRDKKEIKSVQITKKYNFSRL